MARALRIIVGVFLAMAALGSLTSPPYYPDLEVGVFWVRLLSAVFLFTSAWFCFRGLPHGSAPWRAFLAGQTIVLIGSCVVYSIWVSGAVRGRYAGPSNFQYTKGVLLMPAVIARLQSLADSYEGRQVFEDGCRKLDARQLSGHSKIPISPYFLKPYDLETLRLSQRMTAEDILGAFIGESEAREYLRQEYLRIPYEKRYSVALTGVVYAGSMCYTFGAISLVLWLVLRRQAGRRTPIASTEPQTLEG